MTTSAEILDTPAAAPAAPERVAVDAEPTGPVTIIEPPTGWQLVNVRELWQFRELIVNLGWRDIKVRYKQTFLGVAWAVVQPLMMMVVFSIFFGRLAKVPSGGVPYPLFVLSGLIPWTFFSSAIAAAGNSVVASERLVTKIYFPRLAVPFSAVGALVVDFVIACALLLITMLVYGVTPGPQLAFVPVILALLVLASLGIGTFLAALNVAYRDVKYIIPFLVQVGMYATPTIYMQPPEDASGLLGLVLILNPMTTLVSAFRASVLGGAIPWMPLLVSAVLIILSFVLGCLYFRKVEDEFADLI